MKKIKSSRSRRDRNRPEQTIFNPQILKKALKHIENCGLNAERLQILLRLQSVLDADKIIFHLQSHHPERLKRGLVRFRNKQISFDKIEKWEYNASKDIQSLEYYLSL